MSEPGANTGKRPPGALESDAGKGVGRTATLACDNLRVDHRRIEAYLDRLLAVPQHLSAERIPEVQSVYSRKENGAERVTKILVRGENVAHVF